MESFARRGEDVLLGQSPYGQYGNSPKSTNEDSDMDFSDVFGGPPRRFSMQEMRMRHSFCEPMESDHQDSVYPEKPWSGFDEKPVFGSENVSRRSYQNDDFYGDIFRRDDSRSYSSPRMSKDVFGSSPVSRILSPARPLPPKAEPFSTSVPAQFSLPAKLTKAMDFPVFGSANRNLYNKSKDGIANGDSHSPTSNVSLSRFSSQAMELPDETRKDESLYHQSPLSNKVSVSSEKLTYETKSVEKEEGEMWKNNSQIADASKNGFQFHFSIYKWAGKGVPLLMPVLESNKLRCKYRSRMERCSSSNGRIHCDSTYNRDLSEVEDKVGGKKREERSKEIKMKSKDTVKGTDSEISDSDSLRSSRHRTPNGEAISERNTDEKSSCKDDVDLCEKTEKEAYRKGVQAQKPVQKPLKALFNDEKQEQGSEFDGEENNAKISTEANEDSKVSSLGKKTTSERSNSNKAVETNASLQGSARVSGNASGKSAVEGTVREFVKIFNQDTSDNPRTNSEVPSQSSRWKGIDINGIQKEIKNVINIEENVHASNTQEMPDAASCKEDHSLKADKQHTHSKSSVHKTSTLFTNDKNARCFSDSLPNNHKAKVENWDESFQGHFLVEELTVGLNKDLQTEGDSENMKDLDAEIQQWSNGRKGNIRSLLSTLQLVLWSGSGWKPVPLVDIIEGSGVKRAYQKALLCLHPDKLQQKGAESHQKYIAARVFDILQEAWDHFNSLGAI